MSQSFDLESLCQSDLSDYLADAKLAPLVEEWLVGELELERWKVRFALKLLSPLAVAVRKGLGGWLGNVAKQQVLGQLSRMAWFATLWEKLEDLAKKKIQQRNAEEALKALCQRHGPRPDSALREALTLDQQTQLLTQEQLDLLEQDVEEGFSCMKALLQDLLNPQPLFKATFQNDANPERRRFVYRSQYIPFVGREPDMKRLESFLYSEKRRVLWQVLVGPGGAGKSRLALECCQQSGAVWYAGIVANLTFNYATWKPTRPTLLVFDYASTDQKRLKEILRTLAAREQEYVFPVRILLVDRDGDSPFQRQLRDDHDIDMHAHEDEPWTIEALGDDGLWSIMQFFFEQGDALPSGTRQEHLDRLKEIDPKSRPIFAAYYADAVIQGHCRNKCDRQSLLRDIISREEKNFWTPAGVQEGDKALLALATIIRGVQTETPGIPEGVTPLSTLAQHTPRFKALGAQIVSRTQEHSGSTSNGPLTTQFLPPWEPDLVGELFVLEFLGDNQDTGARNPWRENLMRAAWDVAPWQTAQFLDRTAQDHLVHPTLAYLLAPPLQEKAALPWSKLTINMVGYYGNAGRMNDAERIYDDLTTLYGRFPTNEEIALTKAKATFNMRNDYGNAGRMEDAERMYDDLTTLCEHFPTNEEIALTKAKAAFNMSVDYRNAGHMDDAERIYGDLTTLCERFPTNEEIALRKTKAAFIMSCDYGSAGRDEDAKRMIKDIRTLQQAFPNHEGISEVVERLSTLAELLELGKR